MRTVFLTGATGFLGHYVLRDLLRQDHVRVRVLLSPRLQKSQARLTRLLDEIGLDLDAAVTSQRVEFVEGRLPDGLDDDSLRGVHTILHVAASTRFRSNREGDPARSNVEGTAALLDAARIAGVQRFVFVSTAYVGGLTSGCLPEAPAPACALDANDYERSKFEAEERVLGWTAPDRQVRIVRPSILIGDEENGRATSFGGIYTLARAVELLARAAEQDASIDRRAIPLRIVGSPKAFVNVAPVCWASRHLTRIALTDAPMGGVINLVNPSPPTSDDVRRWLEEVFDVGGGRFTRETWPWTDASAWEDAFYAAGEQVRAYLGRDVTFETTYLASIGESHPLVDATQFERAVRFARDARWGRSSSRAESAEHSHFDPARYFEEFVPSRLPQSSVASIRSFSAIVRYVIEGLRNGEWVCRYNAGRLIETHRGPNTLSEDFGFRIQRDAFEHLVTGRKSLQSAYFQAEAEIFGNTLMALKMTPIIDTFIREHPLPAPQG
ncbi:MAG: SDR family oxidoreductase [Phycisphaerales bacterium]|nr:SDR family oxidoreductase [Phycisphaerales bacterium]